MSNWLMEYMQAKHLFLEKRFNAYKRAHTHTYVCINFIWYCLEIMIFVCLILYFGYYLIGGGDKSYLLRQQRICTYLKITGPPLKLLLEIMEGSDLLKQSALLR